MGSEPTILAAHTHELDHDTPRTRDNEREELWPGKRAHTDRFDATDTRALDIGRLRLSLGKPTNEDRSRMAPAPGLAPSERGEAATQADALDRGVAAALARKRDSDLATPSVNPIHALRDRALNEPPRTHGDELAPAPSSWVGDGSDAYADLSRIVSAGIACNRKTHAPSRRMRVELFEAALKPRELPRRHGFAPPVTASPAWVKLLAREVANAARPLVSRIAASVMNANVSDEVNAGGVAQRDAEEKVRAASGAGQPLPPELIEQMGRALGHTFTHVRIHTDAAADAAAKAIGARAFTLGSHVYFAAGEFAPGTEAGDRLLRHELTHVVQFDRGQLQPTRGGIEVAERDSATEVEARAAEERTETAPAKPATEPAKGAAPAKPAAPAPAPAATGVVSALSLPGPMMSVVQRVSPRLASLIQNGLEGTITPLVQTAVQTGLKALVPSNPLGGLASIGLSIGDIVGTLIGAANGDAKCCETFRQWCEKLGGFATKASKSKFVQDIKKGFDEVDGFIGSIVKLFGGALVDSFRDQLNDIKAVGGVISDGVHLVGHVLQAAADAVLKVFNLPSVASIEAELMKLAEKLWQKIKDLVKDGIEKLKEVAKILYTLSGLEGLVELMKFAGELVEVVKWLVAHRNDADIVKHAREQMAHTFLPQLLDKMGGLVGKIQSAIAWCEQHVGATMAIVAAVGLVLIGPLAPIAIAIAGIGLAIKALWDAFGPQIKAAWEEAKKLVQKIYAYAQPVIDTFTQIGFVITNPWALPMVLMSSAWLLLPECFKGPLIDLGIDLITAALVALPDSSVLFGPLWRFLKTGAISFLGTVKATWSTPDKVTAVNRIAKLGSGRSTEAMAGFVVGFFKGLVIGVIDPFKMVYDLLKIGWDVTSFFTKLAAHAPQVAPVINKWLPQLQAKAETIMSAGKQALDDFVSGKIGFDDLWALLQKFMDSIDTKAGEIGVTAAGKLKGWMLGGISDWDIGDTIGIAVGYIVVFALITYFSGGVSAEAEGALAVVRTLAKILNAPYELMGAMLKPLEVAFKPVLKVLATIGEKIGAKAVWEGAMKAFTEFSTILGKFIEELIVAMGEKGAEKLLAKLTEKVGAELAEKLITELGEKAAEELVDKLGEKLVKELGEKLTPAAIKALSDKLGKELIEKLLERGFGPEAIEKLGGKLDAEAIQKLLQSNMTNEQIEKLVGTNLSQAEIDALLARKLSGAEIDKLSSLSAEKMKSALALPDAQLKHILGLPEAEFGKLAKLSDAGFSRMAALPDAQLAKFLNMGDAQLAAFANMDAAAFARFNGLTDAQLAHFANMPADKIATFANLPQAAFDRFAALPDAQFGKFAALDGPALERFGGLSEPAFTKFAALDEAALKKFADVPATGLERYGTMPRNFDLIAAADKAAIDKFGSAAVDQATFDKFMNLNGLNANLLNKLGALDANVLTNLAGITDPQAFNILVRRVDAGALGNIGGLSSAEIDALAARIQGDKIGAFNRIGGLPTADIKALAGIGDPALFNRLVATADLKGFSGLSTAELEKFASATPEGLAKFGALNDAAALKKFAALSPQSIAKFGELSPAALGTWTHVQDATLAKFGALDQAALENFGNAGPAALDALAPHISPAMLEQLRFVNGPGIQRFANLPADALAKLEGISSAGLQKLADLPAGELERLATTADKAALEAAAGDDAASKAAQHNQAQALDQRGGSGTGDHGFQKHGAQSDIPDPTTGVSPAEKRLRDGETAKQGVFSSDAAQVSAAQQGDAQLAGKINNPPGDIEIDVKMSAGEQLTLDPPGDRLHGTVVRTQADTVRIVYRPRVNPPTSVADYSIVTMFPYLAPL